MRKKNIHHLSTWKVFKSKIFTDEKRTYTGCLRDPLYVLFILDDYFKFSGFKQKSSGITNLPSFLIRTSSNQISPPP